MAINRPWLPLWGWSLTTDKDSSHHDDGMMQNGELAAIFYLVMNFKLLAI